MCVYVCVCVCVCACVCVCLDICENIQVYQTPLEDCAESIILKIVLAN